jgi:hypothetical protein
MSATALPLYQPVFNLATDSRCDVGLRLPQAKHDLGAAEGLSFVIAPRVLECPLLGLSLDPACWAGASPPTCPPGAFRWATIPPGAEPEAVLARLASWR